mgnify:CR=1 FL=1
MNEEMITDEFPDTDSAIHCRVCEQQMKLITPAHLLSHNMTMADYKKQFPGAPLVCKKNIEKLSQRALQQHSKRKQVVNDSILQEIEKSPSIDKFEIPTTGLDKDFVKKVTVLKNESLKAAYPSTPKDKIFIILCLEEMFGKEKVKNNYFVEKMIVGQYLDYSIITDIAIPSLKLDFEFNNSFWHNRDISRPKYLRDYVLKHDGWTIIDIESRNPTPEDVKAKVIEMKLV